VAYDGSIVVSYLYRYFLKTIYYYKKYPLYYTLYIII